MTTILLLILVALVLLWVFFLSYASLKQFAPVLRPEVKAVGVVVILVGLVIDVTFNWTIGLALGITRDFTFSQKCKRLGRGDDWRAPVARSLCENWLNPFDSEHC